MKKKLNEDEVKNELSEGSAFFKREESPTIGVIKKIAEDDGSVEDEKNITPTNRDTMQPLNHDTMVSRYHDTTLEKIRKALKSFGKESATHRFTKREKRAISELIYAYKKKDVRTSENEITRIAVNFIVFD